MPESLSAVVVAYNRVAIIGTCLRALRFADEVIVVDKSSTDSTADIAARHADRVITVPWTPTVEDTRSFAVAQCSGDWILCLDDDECLSPESAEAIRAELAAPRADIYRLPLKHYILGTHDPAAYYWPEHHPRLFRRGAVTFDTRVHGGTRLCSDRVTDFSPQSGVAIHHLSHSDVREWVEKCNRYTSRLDRVRVDHAGQDLAAFAHARIEHWQAATGACSPGSYPMAAALLRALYDIVDRLKTWEEERGLDGAAAFVRICDALDAAHAAQSGVPARAGVQTAACPDAGATDRDAAEPALRARIAELRSQYDALAAEAACRARAVERLAAEPARLEGELAMARRHHEQTQQALRIEQERRAAMEASTCWRATAGARQFAERTKRLRQWVAGP